MERSSIISSEVGSGCALEDIDMTKVDTEFGNELIIKNYEKLVEDLPTSEKLYAGMELSVKTVFDKVEYTIPSVDYYDFIESSPGN